MAPRKDLKKNVWISIISLILPHWRKFLLVVFIGMLSTGAVLIEPLIYREAINDVAGLFVQRAKDDTRKELGADSVDVDDESPLTNFFEEKIGEIKKEPHSKSHVAARTPEQAIQTLMWAVGLLFVVNLIGHFLLMVGENLNVKLSCRIEQGFIQNTFTHVLKLPLGFFARRSSAALAKQINQSEEVSAVVNGFSQQILPEIISLTGILVIMFWQNVTLTLIAVAIIPFYLLIAWHSANKLEANLSSFYDRWEEVSARMQDALAGIKTVKLSGAEYREADRFTKISNEAYKDYVNRAKLANKYAFWETMLTRLSSALVLGYGGYLTLKHQLTPGDVVMFVAYLDRLYDPIDALASLWVNLQQNVASISRAIKLMGQTMEEKKGKEWVIPHGNVKFNNVRFGYVAGREVLKGITFSIQAGKVTAIVGTSGAGKTTAVDLIMKLYEPSSGEITIDGKKLSDLDSSSVRSQIGMVAADGDVFRGTLADNIRYKRPHATEEEVTKAAIEAGLAGTLQRLPDGLKTKVGESGIGLSVGERQRIQIARILLAHPRILILDEATANLDFTTEAEVKKTIKETSKENTVILIAHRYSMVRDADYVIVLSAGEVLEEGTPDELAMKGGWFTSFSNAAHESKSDRDAVTGKVEEIEDEEDDVM